MAQAASRHDPTSPGGPPADVLAAAVAARVRRALPGGERTVPFGAGAASSARLARLLVTAGPAAGTAFPVLEPLITVGRGVRNAVVIPDVSVSREHIRLEKRGSRWLLTDNASGNGTCVNGQAVRRRRLRHGDEIRIGDSSLRFLEPGGVIVRRPADGERSRSLAQYGRASPHLALAVAMILVVLAALARRQTLVTRVEAEAHRGAMRALARQKLQEGLRLLNEGKASEGRARLLIAAELDGADAEIARALHPSGPDRPAVVPGSDGASTAANPPAAIVRSPARAASVRTPAHSSARPAPAVTAAVASAAAAQADLDGRRARAERHLLAARELSAEQDLPRAAAHLRAALEDHPGNTAAALELERVTQRVREIYLRAYVAKDQEPEAARNGFALVAASLPAADEMASRAARWVERLDARSAR